MRKEIRISGFGGQGVVLASYLLGKALCLYEGFEVVMTQSYGPEARGGASSSNLVVADLPIAYPFVRQPDYLIALSQEAYNRFQAGVKPDGLIFIDEELVVAPAGEAIQALPATRLAGELGRRIVANVVMLGFFIGLTELAPSEALAQAIESSVKAAAVPLNLRALETGLKFARDARPIMSRQPGSQGESHD